MYTLWDQRKTKLPIRKRKIRLHQQTGQKIKGRRGYGRASPYFHWKKNTCQLPGELNHSGKVQLGLHVGKKEMVWGPDHMSPQSALLPSTDGCFQPHSTSISHILTSAILLCRTLKDEQALSMTRFVLPSRQDTPAVHMCKPTIDCMLGWVVEERIEEGRKERTLVYHVSAILC